jgi:hypothetical protein
MWGSLSVVSWGVYVQLIDKSNAVFIDRLMFYVNGGCTYTRLEVQVAYVKYALWW